MQSQVARPGTRGFELCAGVVGERLGVFQPGGRVSGQGDRLVQQPEPILALQRPELREGLADRTRGPLVACERWLLRKLVERLLEAAEPPKNHGDAGRQRRSTRRAHAGAHPIGLELARFQFGGYPLGRRHATCRRNPKPEEIRMFDSHEVRGRFSSRSPSPSMVVALLALFGSLGGAGYAATVVRTPAAPTSIAAAAKGGIVRGPRGPRGPRGARGIGGPAGPQGAQGIAGPQGIGGPQGVAGTQGVPGAPAVLKLSRLDYLPPHLNLAGSSGYEQVESIGTVDKLQADTVLRVTVNDMLGTDGTGGSAGCALQVRIDGATDQGSTSTHSDTGTEAVIGGFNTEVFPATIVAEFSGLPAGLHSLTLWLRQTFANGPGVCTEGVGGDAVPVLHTALVEELQ
jgi:hypothetical protein